MLDSHAFASGETQIAVVTYAALNRIPARINSHASLYQIENSYVFILFAIGFLFFLLVKKR